MLRKGESQLRVGRENPQQHHSRTSWVRSSASDFHNIRLIEWTCPPQFTLDPNWKMEAGSESKETLIQLHRESRTAEAIYLRNFDIPANPSVAPDALNCNGDDSSVPIVPLEVVNDETLPNDDGGIPLITSSPTVKVGETTTSTPPLNTAPLGPQVDVRPEVRTQPFLQRDEVIGTAVALVALIKSKEPGNQIDLELLIQLLRNPGMLDHLMKEHGLVSANQRSIITSDQPLEKSSVPGPAKSELATDSTWSPSVPFAFSMSQEVKNMIHGIHRKSESQSNESLAVARLTAVPNPCLSIFDVGKVRKLINEYGAPLGGDSSQSSARTGPVVVKDSDYFKRLISQHGTPQENPKPRGTIKTIDTSPVESRPQEQRPCVYFNSPRGCRRGSSCRFQHVRVNFRGVSRAMDDPSAKRMKPSGGNLARLA